MGLVDLLLRPEVGWVAGGGMAALAAFLVYIAPRDRVLRAFAAFLVVRGMANLPVRLVADDHLIILLPFVALWFLIEYHDRARLRRSHPALIPAVLLAAVALDLSWTGNWRPAFPDWIHVVNILYPARFLTYAAIALVLAVDGVRRPDPAARWPLLIVSCAFALNPLYHAAVFFQSGGIIEAVRGSFQSPFFLQVAPRSLALLAVMATVLLLSVRLIWRPAPRLRRHVVLYHAALLAVLLAVLQLAAQDPTGRANFSTAPSQALDRLTTLPVPFVVGYVLLRHRLFDIDLRLRSTLVVGIIIGSVSAGFFVAQELLEDLLALQGNVAGLIGAGLVAFAFVPLQRLARGAVDRLMPNVRPTEDYIHHRKLDVYRTALETMLYDGSINAKERRVLDALAANLAIDVSSAAAVEAEVASRLRHGPSAVPPPMTSPVGEGA